MEKKGWIVLIAGCLMLLISMNTLADTITLEKNASKESLLNVNIDHYGINSGETLMDSDFDQFNRGSRHRPRPHPNRGPRSGSDGALLTLTVGLFFMAIILANP